MTVKGKIVYVPKDEDNVLDNLKMKTPWLSSLIEENDDMKIIKEMEAKNDDFKHYIIKCTPKISLKSH